MLHAKFSGDPVPERRWFYNGKTEIKAGSKSSSLCIADKDHSSRLTVMNARREDSGSYEFRVENEFGQETALCDVMVMVEPGKPK